MKLFGLKSQKLDEISGFENLKKLRFRLGLTHENSRNSLNFLDTGPIFWIFSYLYVCKKSYLAK